VAQNTPLTIPVATLLSNDSDADGDPLTLTGVSNAQNGSVSLNNNGTPSNTVDDFVTFTPNAGFSGNAIALREYIRTVMESGIYTISHTFKFLKPLFHPIL